jgi:hypothetical protein
MEPRNFKEMKMDFPTYLQTVKLRAKPMPSDRQIVHAQIGMLTELGSLAT